MRILSLANQKGGVAKSTTAAILASGLNHRGYKVLVIDLDPQGNITASSGIDLLSITKSIYNVFNGSTQIEKIIQSSRIGYDLATGGLRLASADMEFTQTGREYMLREALDAVRSDYDFCIIDTPPTLGILTVNALTASDGVIVPVTADFYSLQGLAQLNQLIEKVKRYSNHDLKIEGLLITRHDDRTNLSKALRENIEKAAETLGTKVFSKPIRNSVAVRESQVMQSDLFTEAPKANATQDYNEFIDELLKGESE